MITARYDDHATWYFDYTRDWNLVATENLPEDVRGLHILDLGCGYGTLSRILAERGAQVTGVDLSERLLDRAQELEVDHQQGIRYRQGNAADVAWWDGEPFDAVVCNMALMDIDDLDGALRSVATVLKPGGWFHFSIFHPCFPGGEDEFGSAPASWSSEGYGSEGWWTTGEKGVRGHVGANHRMLSTYLNATLRAGLVFEQFIEPPTRLPWLLSVNCRRE